MICRIEHAICCCEGPLLPLLLSVVSLFGGPIFLIDDRVDRDARGAI